MRRCTGLRSRLSKHRGFTLRLLLSGFILNDIPVLYENAAFHENNICRNPGADRRAHSVRSSALNQVNRSKTESRVQRRAPGTCGSRRDWSRGR
jgi:hypothetical protein